ncbi:MAG TPA: alpha/beta fold hydrolase [Tissierellia bacterium]|nr:alpha/beta fold hydrolase [Tissierellia bacterium]
MKKMEWSRFLLKVLMWILVIGFGSNMILQTISYSFYKKAKKLDHVDSTPIPIAFSDDLSGYGANLDSPSEDVILFFGGSNYIAHNAVGAFSDGFNNPFLSADYYGSQASQGKMTLSSMQKTAEDLYDWAREHYPTKNIVVMGHSYGAGMATYLASVRECKSLVLFAAYRDLSDLYNKIIPIFWGPGKIFISDNIRLSEYAKNVHCPTYLVGSKNDTVLPASLQQKVQEAFASAEIVIFEDVSHEDYLKNPDVLHYIRDKLH